MAGAVVIDMDAMGPADKRAKIAGKTYLFPGDCPLEIFTSVQALQKRYEDDPDISDMQVLPDIEALVLRLFRVKQPTMKSLPEGIGLVQLFSFVGRLYSEEGDATPPPNREARRAAARSTRSTSPRKKSGSSTRSRA